MFTEEEIKYIDSCVNKMIDGRKDFDIPEVNREKDMSVTKTTYTYEVEVDGNAFSIPRYFG